MTGTPDRHWLGCPCQPNAAGTHCQVCGLRYPVYVPSNIRADEAPSPGTIDSNAEEVGSSPASIEANLYERSSE